MGELKQLLLQTEDEYLIGISNKGMLKRAYKDLETQSPTVEWQEEEVSVVFKDAQCQLRVPLAESSCSCPARSICRHLIGAILYVRQAGERASEERKGEGKEEGQEQRERLQAEKLEAEILAVSPKQLERFQGTKGYSVFLAHLQAGEFPRVEKGAIFTVSFPWENTVVKLLSPLEYATCSCHSKDLCSHKAQAILTIWLLAGKQTLEKLQERTGTKEKWNLQELADITALIKETIQQQMVIGLSRLSREAQESMERLAVISRGARLPYMENEFRQAGTEYQIYRERKAAFRAGGLMERLLQIYRYSCLLEQAKENEEISRLAGSFRDTYEPVARLWLTTVGWRTFQSKTGYEGEIYYFFERKQKQFYTWTDVRPTFYEEKKRRPVTAYREKSVPWGLNCSRKELKQLEFSLNMAKVTKDNRLSVSQETKGEIVGSGSLRESGIDTLVYWNYIQLLQDWDVKGEALILAGAVEIGTAEFDPIEQRFAMELLDEEGNVLLVAVHYSKEEKPTIQFLERLHQRLQEQKGGQLVFLGKTYLEKGQLCLFPISYFMLEELGIAKRRERRTKEETKKVPEIHDQRRVIGRIEDYLKALCEWLEGVFVCGFGSVQENLLEESKRMAGEGEQLGLYQLAHRLSFLQNQLEQKRHGAKLDAEQFLLVWEELSAAVKFCRKKTTYDLALVSMQQKQGRGGKNEFTR